MKRSIWLARSPGSFAPRRMVTAVAAAVTLTAGSAGAADCGCARSSTAPAPGVCSCESSWGHGRGEPGPIYKTLDAFAGGIETLLRLDRSSGEAVCDDSCDAAMIHDLSQPAWPSAPAHPPHPTHRAMPRHDHRVGVPHEVSPYGQSQPDGSLQMSRPRIEPLPESAIPERQLDATRRRPSRSATDLVPQSERSGGADRGTAAPAEGLQDPFLDDSVRVDPRGSRFVQPTAYEAGRAPRVSSRRIKSSR